ncbi:hypothetical protein D3C73_1270760 [compost metagenome]
MKDSKSAGNGTTSRAAARLIVNSVGIISEWKVVIATNKEGRDSAKKEKKYLSIRNIDPNRKLM